MRCVNNPLHQPCSAGFPFPPEILYIFRRECAEQAIPNDGIEAEFMGFIVVMLGMKVAGGDGADIGQLELRVRCGCDSRCPTKPKIR